MRGALIAAATIVAGSLGLSVAGCAVKPANDVAQRASVEQTRDRAAELGNSRDPRAVESLVPLLDHPNEIVRATAAESLGRLGDRSATSALIARREKERRAFVRKQIAYALGSLRDPASAAPIALWFSRERDKEVRAALATALGLIGDASASAALVERIRDKDPFVRRQIAIALGRIGARGAGAEIARLLGEDGEADVRRAAATALGMIGDERYRSDLTRASRDPDPYVQTAALEALRRFGDRATGN